MPDGVNEGSARYLIGLFDHIYWILGSIIGSLAGQFISIDFSGIDFSMTALFVVIFIDQIKGKNARLSGLIGIFCAVICLAIFGPENFILPALVITVAVLYGARPILNKDEKGGE